MNKKFYEKMWFIVLFCIIFPPAGIFLIWKNKKPSGKKAKIFISAILCLWTLTIAIGGVDEENASNARKEPEKVAQVETVKKDKTDYSSIEKKRKDAKENEINNTNENNKKNLQNKKRKNKKKRKEKEKNKKNEESPFPNEEKYIINNTLFRYNKIAEYPIGDEFIEDLKDVGRPLGKINLTISNGVYFIIRYNDFNESLFIDYQEETSDDSGLFSVIRDMTKAANQDIKDKDFKNMWEMFKNGKYTNHYDNLFELQDFEFSFATRVINNGKTEYSVKSRYYINGKTE